MKIAIGNDHAAVELKKTIMEYVESMGHEVTNFGTDSSLHLILHSFDAFSAPYFSGLCIIQCSDNTLYSGNLSYLLKCYCIEF